MSGDRQPLGLPGPIAPADARTELTKLLLSRAENLGYGSLAFNDAYAFGRCRAILEGLLAWHEEAETRRTGTRGESVAHGSPLDHVAPLVK